MSRIVLASASPRRHSLMKQINLDCTIAPADIDESEVPVSSPEKYTLELSLQKARKVSPSFTDHLIIAADTVVAFEGRILGKPQTPQQAADYLRLLSGNTHYVTTGVSMLLSGTSEVMKIRQFYVTTSVMFDDLDEELIDNYIATGSPMDKAGAYGIQDDWGALLVSQIHGDYYNVVGFPINRFYNELRSFAPRFLPKPGFNQLIS